MEVAASEDTSSECCMSCGTHGGPGELRPLEECGSREGWVWLAGGRPVTGRVCGVCVEDARRALALRGQLSGQGGAAHQDRSSLSHKIRALRGRLRDLAQKIDVFIVVGSSGSAGGAAGVPSYSADDIIMVDRARVQAHSEGGAGPPGWDVQCSVCPRVCVDRDELEVHLATHPSASPHCCWTCGRQYTAREDLLQHQCAGEQGGQEAGTGGACPACGWTAESRARLSAHCTELHGRGAQPPLVCPECICTLPGPAELTAHRVSHRRRRGALLVCGHDGCILRFSARDDLLQHVRAAHGGGGAE